MERRKWIGLNYNLPTEPSRPRVAVWRRLKKLGAVNLQQSMWLLIKNEENLAAMQQISQDIEANNGEALIAECVFLEENHEQRVILSFNKIRDDEYGEFINECDKYLKELEKEISIEKFTFAELEEEEEELEKLISWYHKIQIRDIFEAPLGSTAKERLQQIKKAFEEYSELVYQHNNE